jgi:serine/threonine protein kinase
MDLFMALARFLFGRRTVVSEVLAPPPLWSEFTPMAVSPDPSMPILDGYEMLGRVGHGEMGVVYQALREGHKVAVKVGEGERFERESSILAKLDLVLDSGPGYVAYDWIEGRTLEHMLTRRPLEADEFAPLAKVLLAQLRWAHERDICHRDIKTANIVVTLDGWARLVDFGLAMSEGDTRFTMNGYSMGTPAYMAPEVLLKGVSDARSDQYALGVVFFEMLSGWPPFQAECAIELGMMHVRKPVPSLKAMRPEIPQEWVSQIERMLAKEPLDRFSDLAQISFKAS